MTDRARAGATRNPADLTVFQQHEVPEEIRALSTVTDPDYLDTFTLVTSTAKSPEWWARAMIADGAGLAGQLVWRAVFGMRLKWRPARTHVAGWRIADRGAHWLRLEAPSWMLTGQLVIHLDDQRVSLATFVRYDRPIARRIWTLLSPVHCRLAPDLLREAHRAQR